MAQQTNLNVFPYFDDFDRNKNFYRVLFKPGYPLQARELTSLQSILQNQIESFGNHIFKDGSIVIPGGVSFVNNLRGVQINRIHNNTDVDFYIDNLLNAEIVGQNSGVRAKVIHILKQNEDDNPNTILYLNILSDNTSFSPNERLISANTLLPGLSDLTSINAGQSFCTTISSDPNVIGSALTVNEGTYYLRGFFVTVPKRNLILGWDSQSPSYSVGFEITEEIVTAYEDDSLYDNAKGFSNYSSPGSDRLKISTELVKIPVSNSSTDITDTNYVEIFRVYEGEVKKLNRNSQYEELSKEFARRTYDESGNYYVKPFTVEAKESLNDLKGNGGIYSENQIFPDGSSPSESVGAYRISPGKAYVQGYEVESIGTQILNFQKPRSVAELKDQFIMYSTGSTFTLNRVYGAPQLKTDGSYVVSLRDSRVGVSQLEAPGKEIGLARVYDFALETGIYDETFINRNEWDISLYDIQPYVEFVLNEPVSLNIPTHIKGSSSGASAFLRYTSDNSGIITAYNVQGNFLTGEKLYFNDNSTNSRVSTGVTEYGFSDVKSLYGIVGSAYTFTGDIKPTISEAFGSGTITGSSGGISTISLTDPNVFFNTKVKPGDLIAYVESLAGVSTYTYSQIKGISSENNTVTIVGVTTVPGICDGALPQTDINVDTIVLLKSNLNPGSEDRLYAPFIEDNIASVDLSNSTLTIKKEFDLVISNGSIIVPPGTLEDDEYFTPFDEENYTLIREDGLFESLREDKFVFSADRKQLSIFGLTFLLDDVNVRLIASVYKVKAKAKIKNKIRVDNIVVDKSNNPGSGVGQTTINDGLTYGNYPYGTRVQDREICLNYPDVTKVYAVLESSSNLDPQEPSLSLIDISTGNGTVDGFIFGEELVGSNSNAVAIYTGKIDSTSINFIYLNKSSFISGETITGKESRIRGTINQLFNGDRNISDHYEYDQAQNDLIYDYSRLLLKDGKIAPNRRIKIIFERGEYSSSDSGDITTIASYGQFNWCDIPQIGEKNSGDVIDIRPRVTRYFPSENSRSPFEFLGRSFNSSGNSARHLLASDAVINLDYSYYLGRIDKVYLTKDNLIQVKYGEPSENPAPPEIVENALEVATITVPPYLCNASNISISLKEHKRYRMQDIARLEERIKNLEYYTTLSLLEKETSSLSIKDAAGLDRFKSGLFVDNFKTTSYQIKNTVVKNSIDLSRGEIRPAHYTTEIDMMIGDNALLNNEDNFFESYDFENLTNLIGSGVIVNGFNPDSVGKGVATLSFSEFTEINQPFATRIENVTPYFVTVYEGIIDLNPSSDIWVDRRQLDPLTVEGIAGEITTTQIQLTKEEVDSQSGWSPIIWNSWTTQWTGTVN